MTLDQDLLEIEPIFRSTDGTFQFTHPSFQEILTAKQFADEINSGALSVRDAYEQFWSYEDNQLNNIFDVSGRYLLPAWTPILWNLIKMLKLEKVKEFMDVVSTSYFSSKDHFTWYDKDGEERIADFFSPFDDDFMLCVCIAFNLKKNGFDFFSLKKEDFEFNDKWGPVLLMHEDRVYLDDIMPAYMSFPYSKEDEEKLREINKKSKRRLSYDIIDDFIKKTKKNEYVGEELRILGEIGDERATGPLITYIEKKGIDEFERDDALEAICTIGGQKALEFLIREGNSFCDYFNNFVFGYYGEAVMGITKTLMKMDESKIWEYINECVGNTSKHVSEHSDYNEPHIKNEWLYNCCLNVLAEKGTKESIKKLIDLYFFVGSHHWLKDDQIYTAFKSIIRRLSKLHNGYLAPQLTQKQN